jgi:hypothetical protein
VTDNRWCAAGLEELDVLQSAGTQQAGHGLCARLDVRLVEGESRHAGDAHQRLEVAAY